MELDESLYCQDAGDIQNMIMNKLCTIYVERCFYDGSYLQTDYLMH